MPDVWPMGWSIGLFAAAAIAIAAVGTWMTGLADTLADRLGLGEALFGGVFLGLSTSLSGTVTSVSTAWEGQAELAFSNAIGGIAVQTAFLAIADFTYRRSNLEHAAASMSNLVYAGLLVALLGTMQLAILGPDWSFWGIHPVSPLLIVFYLGGLRLVRNARDAPMWRPKQTSDTKEDQPEEAEEGAPSTRALLLRFAAGALAVGVAGWVVGQSGISIARQTGLSQGVVGMVLTATATSLPELVTTLAAVRRGALTLAVGDIIGGNTFDVLFLPLSDAAYREGSIYHAVGAAGLIQITVPIVMTAVLILGLLARERHGVGNIGFESAIILLLYGVGVALLTTV